MGDPFVVPPAEMRRRAMAARCIEERRVVRDFVGACCTLVGLICLAMLADWITRL